MAPPKKGDKSSQGLKIRLGYKKSLHFDWLINIHFALMIDFQNGTHKNGDKSLRSLKEKNQNGGISLPMAPDLFMCLIIVPHFEAHI